MPASRRDFHRLAKVAMAEEESHHDVGRVHGGVDVARGENEFGTSRVLAVFLIIECPRPLPVRRLFFVPTDDVRDAFVELTFRRNALETLLYNGQDIVLDKCCRIHRSHEDAAIPTVAVVHEMPYFVRNP